MTKFILTIPGRARDARDDGRICVAIDELPELPWPLRFYFLRTDEGRWANVGFELGVQGPVNALNFADFSDERLEITQSQVSWLLDHFFSYQAQAHAYLDTSKGVDKTDGGRRASPELRALVRAQYETLGRRRGAINHLAGIHGVNRTTIYRWLKRTEGND